MGMNMVGAFGDSAETPKAYLKSRSAKGTKAHTRILTNFKLCGLCAFKNSHLIFNVTVCFTFF